MPMEVSPNKLKRSLSPMPLRLALHRRLLATYKQRALSTASSPRFAQTAYSAKFMHDAWLSSDCILSQVPMSVQFRSCHAQMTKVQSWHEILMM